MTTTAPLSPPNSSLTGSMVSQPIADEQALAIRRRPSSVSGRSATSRRHRGHRSHHGGSSYLPQNEFPNFAHTGDVEIVVAIDGQEKRYMLHRLILAQSSGFFEASMGEGWPRHLPQQPISPTNSGIDGRLATIGEDSDASSSSRSRPGALVSMSAGQKPMWRYELDSGKSGNDNEIPLLVQKPYTPTTMNNLSFNPPPPVRDKPPPPTNGFFRNMVAMQSALHLPTSNSQAQAKEPDSEIIRDYDNLFRIFYNYPPNLDNIDITEAYIQCKTLLTLADLYDALEVVGPRIDHHLLQFQSRLWKQIAKYPPSYLKLGYLARSKAIFAEALIHVVGQWPVGAQQLRSVPDAILDLIEDKVADLDDMKARIEGRLFRLNFTTPRGEHVSPLNAYSDWLVVSLFRHWLAENLTASAPPPLTKGREQPPGRIRHNNVQPSPTTPNTPAGTSLSGGRVFRLLGAAGPAYLGHDEIKRFLRNKGEGEYTRESVRRFERRMEELKNMAKEVVRPLMRNYLELEGVGSTTTQGATAGLGYLTCTKLDEGDYPW